MAQHNLLGNKGEMLASRYLLDKGYAVLHYNWRAGHKEIDLIAKERDTLVFVEVKTRSYTPETVDTLPPPGNAVKADKKRATRHAANRYLYEHPTKKKPRMDVIEIWIEPKPNGKKPKVLRIRHLIGAY